ncbi:hypothetical protein C2S51_022452 [Perilla frutescens var. frutescens]|nr:hypothetical protein C2S51_022452 [Perilla frutescens var. frutescens]
MSCNGCRILRKGCNENCILRQSLQCIESPQAQANATLFVAKFFGRAGLISFLSSVPHSQRPALFQSLLFEACGRTVNPVNGAVGLLWTGNWHVCQSAVETVLGGGVLRSLPEFDGEANNNDLYATPDLNIKSSSHADREISTITTCLDLGLTAPPLLGGGRVQVNKRPATPSDESETTTLESGFACHHDFHQNRHGHQTKLLRLFS